MLKQFIAITCFAGLGLMACQSVSNNNLTADSTSKNDTAATDTIKAVHAKAADAATILSRPQVPIICYHQIRNWRPRDSKTAKDYIVEPENFKSHIKMLADSGYHTVLPDQLYDYLVYGKALPSKPVMLTFDDTDLDQFTIAAPELKKYGYKAVYFIMTVSIGRPNYMNSQQIKELSDAGNVIGSHTWDHHNFKKLKGEDWLIQLDKPTKRLEEITGRKIEYFAYPFGLWNKEGLPELKSRGFKLAFQLAEKRDQEDPLYTVRRILGSGYWSAKTLHNSMKNSF
ncbi:polysaccharide deacetylase family protein [Mucilaginibacter defluvii]|uniref:NodB homology domain-containing protein n=1 Tax=Mucilaginibacter defluvii TaxID=1196019 RepID=A0ABP9FW91_9SPHI